MRSSSPRTSARYRGRRCGRSWTTTSTACGTPRARKPFHAAQTSTSSSGRDESHGWLRKYYPPDSDEPHFDVTPGAERAIEWLAASRRDLGARADGGFDELEQLREP